jgi:hypothetical protein
LVSIGFSAPAQPDLFPDFQFLLVIVRNPVHDLLPGPSATNAGAVFIIPADQFTWACDCHGLVFFDKQIKNGVVQARQR